MPRKAWLLTLQTPDETKTIDVINARKKIGVVETYLGTLYQQMIGKTAPQAVRVSGQEITLGEMRAVLTEVDDETLSRFAISDDGDW